VLRVAVEVHPGARREHVELRADGGLAVWVRARAREGQANAALVALLAERLGLRRAQVAVLRGERARQKLVELPLSGPDELRARLGPEVGR
jgi:uncharacterized protein YggU (UPF0235/DUF167 family)